MNYRILEYYFTKEYQWKNQWFSNTGICKVNIRPSNEFLQNNQYVDYSIFGDCFTHLKKMKTIESSTEVLNEIRRNLKLNKGYYLGGEISGIDILNDKSRAIDNLGSIDGFESPQSWNITTPKEYQEVPTKEILQMITDWIEFLQEQKSIYLRIEKSI